MIGLLILAHNDLASALIDAAAHTYGKRPPQLEAVGVTYRLSPEHIRARIAEQLRHVDSGAGVLILTDIYGATHTNVACTLLARGRYEMVTGVNLPMLLKALNYRDVSMDELIDKALSGGCGGIVCAAKTEDLRKEAGA
ncbi:MAG: PTS fructose transporter subunit IIA [Pseudomonadota bacterium]|nr:MAG: PTS fructose transporter subunit IIA [Pseudomonadota bacterium]